MAKLIAVCLLALATVAAAEAAMRIVCEITSAMAKAGVG